MVKICFLLIILLVELIDLSNGLECNCRLGASSRIIGGKKAPMNFVPWHAILFYNGQFTCGGFIITGNLIATASHCVHSRNATSFKVVVGVNSIKNIPSKFIYSVDSIIKHPEYNDSSFFDGHDISFLKLNQSIAFETKRIEPACISFRNSSLFSEIIVAGFGSTSSLYVKNGLRTSSTISTELKYAKFKEQKKVFFNSVPIIYALNIEMNDSTCNGDSGAPAMVYMNGKVGVVGLNSFGLVKYNFNTKDNETEEIRCNGESGFTRLAFERPFIEKIVGQFCLI